MISFSVSGDTGGTQAWLKRMMKGDFFSSLESQAAKGVSALIAATPADSGLTANAWRYEIDRTSTTWTVWFINDNVQNGFNVAVGLQYGHATGTGGWVEGYDYINPALRPIFDEIADVVWKEVQKA